jgi:hypothetical protein
MLGLCVGSLLLEKLLLIKVALIIILQLQYLGRTLNFLNSGQMVELLSVQRHTWTFIGIPML